MLEAMQKILERYASLPFLRSHQRIKSMRRSLQALHMLVHSTASGFLPAVEDYIPPCPLVQHLEHRSEVIDVKRLVLPSIRIRRYDEELRSVDTEEIEGEIMRAIYLTQCQAVVWTEQVASWTPGTAIFERIVGGTNCVWFLCEGGADAELDL
jgi:hypothetical protein